VSAVQVERGTAPELPEEQAPERVALGQVAQEALVMARAGLVELSQVGEVPAEERLAELAILVRHQEWADMAPLQEWADMAPLQEWVVNQEP
jgi:hypothetical protein